jgi:hypothetical protein
VTLVERSFVTVRVLDMEALREFTVRVSCEDMVTDCEGSPDHDAADDDIERSWVGTVTVNERAWESESVALTVVEIEQSRERVSVPDQDAVRDQD